MITSGGQRSILRIRRVGVLATCPLPRVQPVVEPATISKVLLEVVDGSDAHLAGQPVVDFLDDVILGFHDQLFNVVCIHSRLFRHSGEECHFAEIVGIVAMLDLLRADELVNVLHGDDGGLSVEIEDKELAALLVCELLSILDGLLLSDVEEPFFEEKDDFFSLFCLLFENKCVLLERESSLSMLDCSSSRDLGLFHFLRAFKMFALSEIL